MLLISAPVVRCSRLSNIQVMVGSFLQRRLLRKAAVFTQTDVQNFVYALFQNGFSHLEKSTPLPSKKKIQRSYIQAEKTISCQWRLGLYLSGKKYVVSVAARVVFKWQKVSRNSGG